VKSLLVLLVPFSWLYAAVVAVRNRCYDRGIFGVVRLPVPVVSVGNMTAGGTGKTPFVEYCLRLWMKEGKRAAMVSRGYGRTTRGFVLVSDGKTVSGDARTAGDEPAMIARKFTGTVVAVDEDRVRGAREVVNRFHPDVVILDDGFQHRRLGRSLDIVVTGAGKRLESIRMLPAGLRREPLGSLRRADLVAGYSAAGSDTPETLRRYTGAPVITCCTAPAAIRQLGSRDVIPAAAMNVKKLVGVCGIARPEAFRSTLADQGIHPVAWMIVRDHHMYSEKDIRKVKAMVTRHAADGCVTTEKDSVRLEAAGFDVPCWYLEIELAVTGGADLLREALLAPGKGRS